MNLHFIHLPPRFQAGMQELAHEYGFSLTENGLQVTLTETTESILSVCRRGNEAEICYCQPVSLFRAVGLLLQNEKNDAYCTRETVYFDMNGVMVDGSQRNQLLTLSSVQWLLRMMAAMGLNMLMLYTEDCYDVAGEPYFGYMRPRYTQEELKAIDDYAYALGIEVIPCMQTLAHMTDLLRWDVYGDIRDDQWTMLVGEEKTYALIEKMLAAASAPFRSRRIHIGSDEAWSLGLGEYLTRNGYHSKYEIMSQHLPRVMEIVRKLGLRPMMWGDMFFRTLLPRNGYYTMEDMDFPQELLDSVPPEMEIVYWDYYNSPQMVNHMLAQTEKLKRPVLFAGCVRNNRSFAYNHRCATRQNRESYLVCKQRGIREVFTTIWGDNQPENVIFNTLLGLQLCAEHGYAQDVSEDAWFARFRFCCHAEAEDFIRISHLDDIPGAQVHPSATDTANPSRYLLWQDPLLGLMDANLPDMDLEAYYGELSAQFARAMLASPCHRIQFSFYEKACAALALKAELGKKLRAAYLQRDAAALNMLCQERLLAVSRAVHALRDAHETLWMTYCKPVGWEITDLRYGGLLQRLDTARNRILDYLNGKVESLPELEEARLPYQGREGLLYISVPYPQLVSASRL